MNRAFSVPSGSVPWVLQKFHTGFVFDCPAGSRGLPAGRHVRDPKSEIRPSTELRASNHQSAICNRQSAMEGLSHFAPPDWPIYPSTS